MEKDSPGIAIHPMIIYCLFALVGFGLERVWPLPYPAMPILEYVGYAFIALGMLLLLMASREFSTHNTTDSCSGCSTALISTGPFRFSRNPVYLGLLIMFIGFSMTSSNLWLLIVIVPMCLTVYQMVIAKEEVYLAAKFGEEYNHYKASVRRWV